MIFSHKWLAEYIEGDIPDAEKISRELGLHSFEVEGVEEHGNDFLIDIDVLPNRAHDAFSYIGMAKEVSLVFGIPYVDVDVDFELSSFKTKDLLSLEVEDSKKVPRATKRILRNIKMGPSPLWITEKLEAMGQRSINNVVDITNLVMYEFGQPVHAFDYDTFSQKDGIASVMVRSAQDGEEVETLDGNTLSLTSDMLVITDSEKALDIAGIKGGKDSGISQSTKTIVLSVCNFDGGNIRKTSKELGLRTDASTRFEKGLSPELVMEASNRACHLLQKFAGAEVSEDILDIYPEAQKETKISLRVEKVRRIIGTNISTKETRDILSRLKFVYEEVSEGLFDVTVPMHRLDLEIEEDVIEEIARVYGYENIPENTVSLDGDVTPPKEFYWIHKIKDVLVREGFMEVSTYTFTNKGEVELKNALAEDKNFLRSTLEFGFENAKSIAEKTQPLFGLTENKLFEIGKVFTKDEEYWELMVSEDVSNVLEKECGVESLFEQNKLNLSLYIQSLPEPKQDLESLSFGDVKYKNISQFPFVLRDMAVWVPEKVSKNEVKELIKEKAGDLLVRADLFDEYPKEGRVSYAFKLVFQSVEKTLTDDEVSVCTDDIYKAFEDSGWEVR